MLQAIFLEASEQYMPMGQSISAVDPTEQCEPVEKAEGKEGRGKKCGCLMVFG